MSLNTSPTLQIRALPVINAKEFGARGDGTTDDTAALQAFITYCIVNSKRGFIPAGTYKISSTLNFTYRPGWWIEGAGGEVTFIKQATDNIAIFNLGSDTASLMHDFRISGLSFGYSNTLQTGNTSAACILISQMIQEGAMTDLSFDSGYVGIKVASGVGGPWGMTFDDLRFGANLTGCAIDMTGALNAVPNNHFGRMFVTATNMTTDVFKNMRGYNCVIDTIEIINAANGVALFSAVNASKWVIGTIKLENGQYNPGAGNSVTLWNFPAGAVALIGYVYLGGNNLNVTSGTVYVVGTPTAPSTGFAQVGFIEATPTSVTGAAVYLFAGSAPMTLGRYIVSNIAGLTNIGSTSNVDNTMVTTQMNNGCSYDKGDASYTVNLGDPNFIAYQTTLTAARTITLPASQWLFTGLFFEVIVNGAAPTATNTLTIQSGSHTVATVTSDKWRLRFVWRRLSATDYGAGWSLIEKVALS